MVAEEEKRRNTLQHNIKLNKEKICALSAELCVPPQQVGTTILLYYVVCTVCITMCVLHTLLYCSCILTVYLFTVCILGICVLYTVLVLCVCVYYTVCTSAGLDLLDPLDSRTYFFNCLGFGAKRSFWIFTTRILAADLSDPISSNLAFLLSICYVKS